ncbi:Cyclin-dependent kinase 6 [Tupaia chinensis]|uniref:Cyclin-dependent kinase 6 n=1 Tax=Tupaia chinensis TaxID=246437 RepID=L9K362_TUPCH|nr:Cyclin-dependent kinase 6 [Tupaia chinensis]
MLLLLLLLTTRGWVFHGQMDKVNTKPSVIGLPGEEDWPRDVALPRQAFHSKCAQPIEKFVTDIDELGKDLLLAVPVSSALCLSHSLSNQPDLGIRNICAVPPATFSRVLSVPSLPQLLCGFSAPAGSSNPEDTEDSFWKVQLPSLSGSRVRNACNR